MSVLEKTGTHYLLDSGNGDPPRWVVRVSTILDAFFPLQGSPEVLAHAAARGTSVHRACELDDGGGDGSGLSEQSLDARLWPYIAAYRRFKTETHLKILTDRGVEAPVYSAAFGYTGTPDRLAAGLGRFPNHVCVLDLKSGEPRPRHGLQLAAYEQGLRESHTMRGVIDRYAVYLRSDGSYRLEAYTDRSDLTTFLAAVQLYGWMQRHGKEKDS